MLPTLSKVKDATHRVVCAGHMRELSIGAAHFANDHKDNLPASIFGAKAQNDPSYAPQFMQTVRVSSITRDGNNNPDPDGWDGLGQLFRGGFGVAAGSYYCPAHRGEHRQSRYAPDFSASGPLDIVSNYQYRTGRNGSRSLSTLDNRMAFIADGLSSQSDFSHSSGSNVARLDLSVNWFNDPSGLFVKLLPESTTESRAGERVDNAWTRLDQVIGSIGPVAGGNNNGPN